MFCQSKTCAKQFADRRRSNATNSVGALSSPDGFCEGQAGARGPNNHRERLRLNLHGVPESACTKRV